MAERFHTYSCVFNDPKTAKWWYESLFPMTNEDSKEVDRVLVEAGLKPISKKLEYPIIESITLSENMMEAVFLTRVDENLPVSFVKDMAAQGAEIIIKTDLNGYDESLKKTYYINGNKASKKRVQSELESEKDLEKKFLLAVGIESSKHLKEVIEDLGGYDCIIFNKPLLFYVAENPHLFSSIVSKLLESIDVNQWNEATGGNVVHHLLKQKEPDIDFLYDLIDSGANVHVADDDGNTPVMLFPIDKWYSVSSFVKKGNIDVHTQDLHGLTIMHKLAMFEPSNFNSEFKDFLDLGFSINTQSPLGTVLWLARKSCSILEEELIELGAVANPGEDTYSGSVVENIITAIGYRDIKSFERLIKSGEIKASYLDLAIECLSHGFFEGLKLISTMLDKPISISSGILARDEDGNEHTRPALEHVFDSMNTYRLREPYFECAKEIIANSPATELNEYAHSIKTRTFWFYPLLYLDLFDWFIMAGGDASKITVGMDLYSDRKFNRFKDDSNKEKLQKIVQTLLSQGISLSDPFYQSGFEYLKKDTLLELVKMGVSGHYFIDYMRKEFKRDPIQLAKFLITLDFTDYKVYRGIWTFVTSMTEPFSRHQKPFNEEFMVLLLDNGFPVNMVFKQMREERYTDSYWSSRYGGDSEKSELHQCMLKYGLDRRKVEKCMEIAKAEGLEAYAMVD